jgi:hypothetical protein
MQHISRWIPALAALAFTAACSNTPSATAPSVPAGFSADVTAGSCQTELDALRAAIQAGNFTGKNGATDKANLLLKVDAAQAKLAEGKPVDAIEKLENVRVTVVALSTPDAKGKTKLDAAGAAGILSAVDAAEACIQSLSAGSTL